MPQAKTRTSRTDNNSQHLLLKGPKKKDGKKKFDMILSTSKIVLPFLEIHLASPQLPKKKNGARHLKTNEIIIFRIKLEKRDIQC